MKRDKILSIQPGSELDALVAEKVMGFKNVRSFRTRYVYDNVGSLGHIAGQIDVPEFSTDISAAWEVETKMLELGKEDDYGFELMQITGAYEKEAGNSNFNMFKVAHASPSDRCKAALLTVLEEGVLT